MSLSNSLKPNLSPNPGVFISANGKIIIKDKGHSYEVVKVNRAIIRMNNNIGTYFETGSQTGTTYAGMKDVNGSITRAYMNMMEPRLVMGGKNSIDNTLANLMSSDSESSGDRRTGVGDFSRYNPSDISIQLVVGQQRVADGSVINLDKQMIITAKNVLFSNTQIVFDARDLIKSGPLDFIASHAHISLLSQE